MRRFAPIVQSVFFDWRRFLLPTNIGGHPAYHEQLLAQLCKYYPHYSSIPTQYLKVIDQFWHFDLSNTDIITRECYSKFAPRPRLPSCMLRSFLLSIKLKITSLDHWVTQMRGNPLFAILSSFQYGAKAPQIQKISIADLITKREAHPPDSSQPCAYLTQLF